MAEEKLLDHIISRLEPQLLDYVEVQHPQTTSSLLQLITKYEESFRNRMTRSHDFRNAKHNANNQFTNRNRHENWRDTRVESRYHDPSRPQRESNRFGSQGVGDNRRFDSRCRSGQSDNRFNIHGAQQGGSRNGAFRGQNGQNSVLLGSPQLPYSLGASLYSHSFERNVHHSPVGHRSRKVIYIRRSLCRYFSYRPRQRTKDRVVTAQGAPCCHLDDQIKPLPIVEKPVEIDLSNKKLGERQKEELQNLFNSFKGLFSDKPGLTHVLNYEIDTEDQRLIVLRPYRYDRVKQGIINYHIRKMLKDCTIRPIQSPYASPVVLTRKNNGLPQDSPEAYRFTIDYRKLNAITKYPRYPLPLIDDLITNIPSTTVMLTLDLRSGYFQLAINPRDIEKTAFITRNGTFAFNRMPFGLSGTAPTFQKAIDIILKPVLGRFVRVYMWMT
ncbi:retrovirus-related Pol polyprotein from transposon opus [Trichonephila clavipes]|nr:retrovirus-related Pol polyprotein from transposon opus [Trichonephila clavipes]